MTITFTGKYSRSNSALRNETSSGVNSADLACVRLRSGGPTRKGHQSRQPRSRPLTGALACVLHRYSSVFGFIRLFDSFRRYSFRDRKLDWLLCDHPFLRGSKFPHRGILILDARSRQSSIAPTSPHPPNLMCLKVQRKLRKFQSERYSTRRRRFFYFCFAPPPHFRRHRAEREPFPTFPGRHFWALLRYPPSRVGFLSIQLAISRGGL